MTFESGLVESAEELVVPAEPRPVRRFVTEVALEPSAEPCTSAVPIVAPYMW